MVSHLWQKFADYSSISSNIYIYIDTVFQYAFNSSTLLQFLIYLEYFSAAYYAMWIRHACCMKDREQCDQKVYAEIYCLLEKGIPKKWKIPFAINTDSLNNSY